MRATIIFIGAMLILWGCVCLIGNIHTRSDSSLQPLGSILYDLKDDLAEEHYTALDTAYDQARQKEWADYYQAKDEIKLAYITLALTGLFLCALGIGSGGKADSAHKPDDFAEEIIESDS